MSILFRFIKDASKKSNKIVFDDEDSENSKKPSQAAVVSEAKLKNGAASTKPNLFNDDLESGNEEEDYSKNFEIKEQFQGKKGERLMKLQSRFQSDTRFKMDSKFLEDDHNDDSDNEEEKPASSSNNGQPKSAEDDEREWQYNILESVMGKKVHHEPTKKK